MTVFRSHRTLRTLGAVLGTGALALTSLLGVAPAAQALPTTVTVTVMAATQKQANPNLNTSELKGWYAKGARITLTCYTYGQAVKGWGSPGIPGGWDNLWYKTTDGTYSADVDLATGTNGPAVANRCGTPAPAPTSAMTTFYKTVLGTSVANAAGTFRGECVSLVSQYLLQVRGLRTGAWGNAVDYRSGGTGGQKMKAAGWTWHTDKNFRDGDVIVWGQYPGWVSTNGHIGVWYAGKTLEQNWVGKRYVTHNPFQGRGFLGYWRR